ncbi:hypothetical protein [Agromyces sp. Leaf222]|uniref:hypothetical protein n=1 Tax=Agromyces sp. Leaf222 TaxID=1735688 RepID=UPI0006F2FD4D|nr:hypothetical protein [Agromyces sp. Leaf222]KQM83033.1 hypothetical protein ASE68_07060 [Agromyces sp. Leaf222]
MNDDHELDPEARLRAADPAAGVQPRAGFVDEVVAAATDADAAGTESGATPEVPVTDLAAERARRRPRWIPIAAVAASLVVFGGAGYAVGAANGGSTNLAGGAAPAISLQGTGGGAMPEQNAAQADSRAGAGAADKMSADMSSPYGYGRNEFSSSGLGTTAGTALGYGYDARSASNAETVSALAVALGVEGTPELKDGSWVVGAQDGTSPSLTVGLDGTLSFSFYDPRLDPWSCPATGDGSDGTEGGDAVDPAADPAAEPGIDPGIVEPCEPTGSAPSEATAIDALRSIITATGRDADAFEYSSQTWEGSVTRTAQALPVIDGQRLDQGWSAEVSEKGLLSAYGALADLVPLGDYEIVSEQEAFERLSDPRFGAQMTALPIAYREDAVTDSATEWVPPTEPPAAPTSGASVSWPVNQVEIVSARTGLASQWQPDGSVLVVPAYEFTDAGGGTWSVIAVADSKLDFTSTAE